MQNLFCFVFLHSIMQDLIWPQFPINKSEYNLLPKNKTYYMCACVIDMFFRNRKKRFDIPNC